MLGQNINLGIPPIRNFSKSAYQAGTQNWGATQDSRGVLFFANNEGLLQFDGSRWTCYPVANKTVVRSVAIDTATGRIFVGAQNEFGYFFPAANGQLRYHSLVGLLPLDKRNFEDIWDIALVGKSIFFGSKRALFQFTEEKVTSCDTDGDLMAIFATQQGLLVQRDFSDLLIFENGAFRPLCRVPELTSELTSAMRWQGDTLLFSSLKNGLFALSASQFARWRTSHDAFFQEKRIYSAAALPDGHLALATSLDGFVELDEKRRIFRHLTKKNGLQNNNILHAFADRAGNLWLGLDNGIDCVVLPSPFTSVVPDADLQGTGYAAAVFEGHLFLGVSNGVYQTAWQGYFDPEQKRVFEKNGATGGQVWALSAIGDELLLGHHEGSFRLSGQACSRISAEPGAWTFVQLNEDFLIGGNYAGLVLYRKSGKIWTFYQKIAGLDESCRFIVKDADGAIWVAHPYKGLFRIEQPLAQADPPRVSFFNAKNGLPSDLNNLVFSIAGRAVFATEKGIFRFDRARSLFVPDEDFGLVLGTHRRVEYLREDVAGNIWYVSEKEVGRLEVADFGLKKAVKKRVFPELTGRLVSGFEFVFPADESNVFFGAEHGFIHFNAASQGGLDTALHVVLGQVTASGAHDSLIFGGNFLKNGHLATLQDVDNVPVLAVDQNNLRFVYSATHFDDLSRVEYRFRLSGLDDAWSEWSDENTRSFTHLSPGKYRFEVQARLKNGRSSEVVVFTFRIRPPWYASPMARVACILALLGLFIGFLVRQRRKFEREKTYLTVQHAQITAEQQRAVVETKTQLTDALRDKLEAEIRFKNKELATATMHLVQKGEILQTVQENLNQILENSSSPTVKKQVQQLLNLLGFDAQLDDDWEHFAHHFDQVHVDFLKRLRERYPQISPTDCRLCAYLRMNLTTKEIAPLMNISVRGVEASRYRLRKKLGLPNDANLTEVIAGL
jgi:DNA-binding CsgD family transcriptional regulator